MSWFDVNGPEILRLLDADVPQLERWYSTSPFELLSTYRAASLDQLWGVLASRARADNDVCGAHFIDMMKRQEEIADLYGRLDSLAVELGSVELPLTKRAEWPALRVQVEQAMGPDADASRALGEFEAMDGLALLAELTKLVDGSAGVLDAAVKRELIMLTGSTLALAVAGFNQRFLSAMVPARPSVTFLGEIKTSLDAARHQVWQALVNEDLVAASGLAQDLARLASGQIEEAVTHLAAVARRKLASGSSFVDEGRLALQLSASIGELLCAITVGWYVAWLAKGHASQESVKSWLSAAKTLSFATAQSPPSTVELSTLAGRPDGDLVSIEGVVGAMDLLDPSVATALIYDGQGRAVEIFSREAQLDTYGMSPGAYVQISGRWQAASTEVNGPGLVVDKVHPPDPGNASWYEWITDQMRPVIAMAELAARCSWEPGDDGAANPLQYGAWFVS